MFSSISNEYFKVIGSTCIDEWNMTVHSKMVHFVYCSFNSLNRRTAERTVAAAVVE